MHWEIQFVVEANVIPSWSEIKRQLLRILDHGFEEQDLQLIKTCFMPAMRSTLGDLFDYQPKESDEITFRNTAATTYAGDFNPQLKILNSEIQRQFGNLSVSFLEINAEHQVVTWKGTGINLKESEPKIVYFLETRWMQLHPTYSLLRDDSLLKSPHVAAETPPPEEEKSNWEHFLMVLKSDVSIKEKEIAFQKEHKLEPVTPPMVEREILLLYQSFVTFLQREIRLQVSTFRDMIRFYQIVVHPRSELFKYYHIWYQKWEEWRKWIDEIIFLESLILSTGRFSEQVRNQFLEKTIEVQGLREDTTKLWLSDTTEEEDDYALRIALLVEYEGYFNIATFVESLEDPVYSELQKERASSWNAWKACFEAKWTLDQFKMQLTSEQDPDTKLWLQEEMSHLIDPALVCPSSSSSVVLAWWKQESDFPVNDTRLRQLLFFAKCAKQNADQRTLLKPVTNVDDLRNRYTLDQRADFFQRAQESLLESILGSSSEISDQCATRRQQILFLYIIWHFLLNPNPNLKEEDVSILSKVFFSYLKLHPLCESENQETVLAIKEIYGDVPTIETPDTKLACSQTEQEIARWQTETAIPLVATRIRYLQKKIRDLKCAQLLPVQGGESALSHLLIPAGEKISVESAAGAELAVLDLGSAFSSTVIATPKRMNVIQAKYLMVFAPKANKLGETVRGRIPPSQLIWFPKITLLQEISHDTKSTVEQASVTLRPLFTTLKKSFEELKEPVDGLLVTLPPLSSLTKEHVVELRNLIQEETNYSSIQFISDTLANSLYFLSRFQPAANTPHTIIMISIGMGFISAGEVLMEFNDQSKATKVHVLLAHALPSGLQNLYDAVILHAYLEFKKKVITEILKTTSPEDLSWFASAVNFQTDTLLDREKEKLDWKHSDYGQKIYFDAQNWIKLLITTSDPDLSVPVPEIVLSSFRQILEEMTGSSEANILETEALVEISQKDIHSFLESKEINLVQNLTTLIDPWRQKGGGKIEEPMVLTGGYARMRAVRETIEALGAQNIQFLDNALQSNALGAASRAVHLNGFPVLSMYADLREVIDVEQMTVR